MTRSSLILRNTTGQIEVHPYVYAQAKPVIEYCHSKGIRIATYTSLASIIAFPGGPVDAVVNKIAGELGVTEDQILLKWAHQVTHGGIVVTTSSKKDRLLGQMRVLADMKELSVEQVQEIADAGAKKYQRAYVSDRSPEPWGKIIALNRPSRLLNVQVPMDK